MGKGYWVVFLFFILSVLGIFRLQQSYGLSLFELEILLLIVAFAFVSFVAMSVHARTGWGLFALFFAVTGAYTFTLILRAGPRSIGLVTLILELLGFLVGAGKMITTSFDTLGSSDVEVYDVHSAQHQKVTNNLSKGKKRKKTRRRLRAG